MRMFLAAECRSRAYLPAKARARKGGPSGRALILAHSYRQVIEPLFS